MHLEKLFPLAEFPSTPKFGVLLRIRSFSQKHSEFTPKFGVYRLWHWFCFLNGSKSLSGSWDMTKWRLFEEICLRQAFLVPKSYVENFFRIIHQPQPLWASLVLLQPCSWLTNLSMDSGLLEDNYMDFTRDFWMPAVELTSHSWYSDWQCHSL